jgi:hypothetical protein
MQVRFLILNLDSTRQATCQSCYTSDVLYSRSFLKKNEGGVEDSSLYNVFIDLFNYSTKV